MYGRVLSAKGRVSCRETGKNGQYYDPEQAKTWKQAKYDGREVLFLSVNSGKYHDDSVKAIREDAPVAILLHVNEQKIHHKYVKGSQMIPAGLINMHSVWLDRA